MTNPVCSSCSTPINTDTDVLFKVKVVKFLPPDRHRAFGITHYFCAACHDRRLTIE